MNTLGDLARKIAELDPPPTNLDVCRAYADACRDVRRDARHEARARRAALEARRRDEPEEWRPVPGIPGYEFSSRDRLRSYLTRGRGAGRTSATPRVLGGHEEGNCLVFCVTRPGGGQAKLTAATLRRLAFGADAEGGAA